MLLGPQLLVEVRLKQKFDCSGVSSGGGEIRETKKTSDSQVPQGSGLLCELLQRSCMVERVGANALVGSELSSNNWWFPSNFCEPYGVLHVFRDI